MSPRAMQSKATWASCVAAWSSRDASSRAGLPFSVSASVITVYLPVLDWLGPRGFKEKGTGEGLAVGRVVTEVETALNDKRHKFLALLRDGSVKTIVVEHRNRFARFGAEYVEAALA